MSHSSTFLLPTIPEDPRNSVTYSLVMLNQRLPRFTPLLWKHGTLFFFFFWPFLFHNSGSRSVYLICCVTRAFFSLCNSSTTTRVCWWRRESRVRRNASVVPAWWRSRSSTQVLVFLVFCSIIVWFFFWPIIKFEINMLYRICILFYSKKKKKENYLNALLNYGLGGSLVVKSLMIGLKDSARPSQSGVDKIAVNEFINKFWLVLEKSRLWIHKGLLELNPYTPV